MRLTATLTILSAAAVASASIFKNTASKLCLDVKGDLKAGASLIMTHCNELKHGDWSMGVNRENKVLIMNRKITEEGRFCVALQGVYA
ncbi:hypothetical protein EC968_005693, partial [Mortierella alpina]